MDVWEGAAKLLSAGPLGLGAIVVILTGTLLMQGKAIERGRYRIAVGMLSSGTLLVLVGFGVLVLQSMENKATAEAESARANRDAAIKNEEAAKAAQPTYPVHFRVEPLDAGARQSLPPPIVVINGDRLNQPATYSVHSEVTAIVDVSDAIDYVKQFRETGATNTALLKSIIQQLDGATASATQIPALLDKSCPGGPNGIQPIHAGQILSINSALVASWQTERGALQKVIENNQFLQ